MTHKAHEGSPWIVPAPIWYSKHEGSSRPEQVYDLMTMQVATCILMKLSGLYAGPTELSEPYMGSGVLMSFLSIMLVPSHMITSLIQEHPDLYKQCLCELYGMCEGVSGSGKGSDTANG